MKNVVLLFIMRLFLITSPTFAMESEGTTEVSSHVSLAKQLEKVVEYIDAQDALGIPAKLFLGGLNTEYKRIGEGWIFFDVCQENQHDPLGKPYIQASFNDIEALSFIANTIGPRLGQILMDDSTFKFTQWKKDHMQLFAAMLKDNGEFIFPAVPLVGSLWPQDLDVSITKDSEVMPALKTINPWLLDNVIPLTYTRIDALWTEEDRTAYTEFLVSGNYSDERAMEFIMQMNKKMCDLCEDELYYPHIVNIVAQGFQNVRIEKDVPFLVRSSFGNTKCTYVYGTRPKR